VDDIALTLVPVPSAGHFNQALLGTFSRAPKEHFTDAETIQRDRKKSDVCRALGFDLLRVTKPKF